MPGEIRAIAEAIKEVSKVVGQWLSGRERRRLKAAIDNAEQYIFANEAVGHYKDMTPERRLIFRDKFRRRFFKYNQG